MTSIEYSTIQGSTPIRASITRTLFQLALAPFRVIFRVLPHPHPARLYMNGRVQQLDEAMNETLDHRGFRLVQVAVIAALVVALFFGHAVIHALGINPIEGIFVKGEQPLDFFGL